MLAPSAYLASAASTLLLQQSILPDSIWMQGDQSMSSTATLWTGLANSAKPSQQTQHIQKAWDGPVAANQKNLILSRAPSDVDKAGLLAAASPDSGDWRTCAISCCRCTRQHVRPPLLLHACGRSTCTLCVVYMYNVDVIIVSTIAQSSAAIVAVELVVHVGGQPSSDRPPAVLAS